MSRIAKKFLELKRKKQKALIVYLTAGDPSLKMNENLIASLEEEGVDMIELGVPFSDPLADGPVIQEASTRALAKGTHLDKILQLVRRVREKSQLPIILMSYFNPIWHSGIASFAQKAKRSGVDGLIVPDLPPEEGLEVSSLMRRSGIDLIYLLAPTSTPQRRKRVLAASRGFVYYVSLTGVTGMRRSLPSHLAGDIHAIQKLSRLPLCVGFGVSTPSQAKLVAKEADGVIIGSAVVKALSLHPTMNVREFSKRIIRPFVLAVKGKGRR